jgi:diaminohydroxyphosphoribosylaminopyrimidine deaminase/5-amino-6-(5-phosphoribosylamino)uracil reductase
VKIHEKYIKRCIEIAKNGLGTTRPNPMVGCVIVHKNTIIGEGYTSAYGGNHAEVNAINSVTNKVLLKDSTLYVTLEPCSHFGKTPPCCDLIIKHQISNIVIGCIDDNPEVAGKGIERLKQAQCKVIVGVLEEACKEHHKRFFTFHKNKRPFIILKWAETVDGFIAPAFKHRQEPVWITNEFSRQLVHQWRSEEHAILVGTKTVIEDNPSLTIRDWTGNNPIRIVLDKDLKLSKELNVFNSDSETIIISSKEINYDNNVAYQICSFLYKNNIQSVIIEGGTQTIQTFINENLWDEARVFIGSVYFKNGIEAPNIAGRLVNKKNIVDDILKIYENNN